MHIAVTTPSGHVGSHVIAQLIRAGVRPRVLTRHPDRFATQPVNAVGCDQFVADDVVAATVGVDALFWVDPTTGSDDPLGDYGRATDAVVAAVRTNRIGRVVFQSSVGAEKRDGAGEIDGLAATEVALDATEADVVHLRCGFFFSNLELQLDSIRAGVVPVILPLHQPLPWVAPRDIADVAVGRLLNRDWSGRVLQAVHGREDLSWEQAAAIVSEATGHPFVARRIPDAEMRDLLTGSGMGPALVDAVIGMSIGLRDDFVPELPRSAVSTTPTSLATWAYSELKPLLR